MAKTVKNAEKLPLLFTHFLSLSSHFLLHRKLNDLLDALEFNQVVIFVSKVNRAIQLNKILEECNFPSIVIHGGLKQEERIARFKSFKEFNKRILVSTDLFGRGIDIERVNIVINYDFPDQVRESRPLNILHFLGVMMGVISMMDIT